MKLVIIVAAKEGSNGLGTKTSRMYTVKEDKQLQMMCSKHYKKNLRDSVNENKQNNTPKGRTYTLMAKEIVRFNRKQAFTHKQLRLVSLLGCIYFFLIY